MIDRPEFLVQVMCMTYNHANYIKDAMDGFVMQKTSFPFVCIITDDASSDGEPDVIKKYFEEHFDKEDIGLETPEETDEYIRFYGKHKENNNCYFIILLLKYNHFSIGKAKTKNLAGFAKPRKYIALCEGDDYWIDPLKLQKQVNYMETHDDCSCYAHNSLKYDTQTRKIELFNKKIFLTKDYALASFISRDWFTPTQSLLYRHDSYHSFEDMISFMHGDYSLLINVLLEPNSYLHYENDIMSVYRDGGYASTHYKEKDLYNDFIALLEYYKQKSSHRCDDVFDKQIERQKKGLEQSTKFQLEQKRTQSLFVRVGFWFCRAMAFIINKYVKCIHVTKRLVRESIPNLENLD